MTNPTTPTKERWLGPGVADIGAASFLAFGYLAAWMVLALMGLLAARRNSG